MRLGALLLAAVLCAGCSASADDPGCKTGAQGTLRARLNPGYALLYQEAEALPKLHWLLLFKHRSADESRVVDDAIDYWHAQARDLEVLAKGHPGLDLQAGALPEVIGRARETQGQDQFRNFRPITGEHDAPFERDLLLLLRDAVDEQRHLAWEIQNEETEPALKQFLSKAHARLDEFYSRFDAVLRQRYFADPAAAEMPG